MSKIESSTSAPTMVPSTAHSQTSLLPSAPPPVVIQALPLSLIVPLFTHMSPTGSSSLIDLALLSEALLSPLQSCTTLPPLASSDHLGVSVSINLKPIPHCDLPACGLD